MLRIMRLRFRPIPRDRLLPIISISVGGSAGQTATAPLGAQTAQHTTIANVRTVTELRGMDDLWRAARNPAGIAGIRQNLSVSVPRSGARIDINYHRSTKAGNGASGPNAGPGWEPAHLGGIRNF